MRAAKIIRQTAAGLAVAVAVFAQCAAGAEPTIHDFAKAAVERKEVRKTDMLGFGIVHTAYRDAPRDGAILIGFDVALSRWDDRSEIVALRPIYLTPRGEVVGSAAGSFSSSRDHKITQTIRVAAKPGYAVGRVTMVTGLQIHAMSVTFMRIKGQALDKNDTYRSPMFGNRGGSEDGRTLSGNGGPIVGVYGNVKGPRVYALGLIVADPTEVDEDEGPPEPAAALLTPAAASPGQVVPEVPELPAPKPADESTWVPFAVGGFVVVMVVGVGLGLMLVVNRITSSSTPPSKTKRPRPPRPPGVRPTPGTAGDDDIPLVYPVDSPEPGESPAATAPPPATKTPPATPAPPATKPPATPAPPAASAPPLPTPPRAVSPPGQLGMIDYEGDAVAPADRQAVVGGLILGGLFLVAMVAMIYFPLKSARDRVLVPALVGVCGIALTGGCVFALTRICKHITVYENGLRCNKGSKHETLFWADVEAVRDYSVKLYMNGMFQHMTRTLKVRAAGGRKIEFSGDGQGIGGLADAVLQRAYDHITPRVLQRLASGQSVDLGPLEVSSVGVGTRLATVEWSRIGDVQIDNGYVIIYEGGSASPWVKILLGDIDNVRLLFALMDHFGGRRTP